MEQKSILVVDDTKVNIDMLLNILHDYDVIASLSGEQALKIVETQKVDLILLDIVMPQMNGFEVCEILKSSEATKRIPVIFLTAHNDEETIEKAYNAGGIDFVSKPFRPRELRSRVKTLLELREYEEGLEQRVAEEVQKHQKQQELLIQQSKLAEMGEMINVIAHQWKQPLTGISFMAQDLPDQLIHGELTKESVSDISRKIVAQVNFLSQTIEDFRTFLIPSRDLTLFDVKSAIEHVLSILMPQLSRLNITVELSGESGYQVSGYINEFKHVILNIINNAKDVFLERNIEAPYIKISISVQGGMLYITIEDNGGGIPESLLPDKIFESYITTKGESGTGIGLSMSKTIIESRMNGTLSASNSGRGARFEIRLPLAKDETLESVSI